MEFFCDNCGQTLYLDEPDGIFQFCFMCRLRIKDAFLFGVKLQDKNNVLCATCKVVIVERAGNIKNAECFSCKKTRTKYHGILAWKKKQWKKSNPQRLVDNL